MGGRYGDNDTLRISSACQNDDNCLFTACYVLASFSVMSLNSDSNSVKSNAIPALWKRRLEVWKHEFIDPRTHFAEMEFTHCCDSKPVLFTKHTWNFPWGRGGVWGKEGESPGHFPLWRARVMHPKVSEMRPSLLCSPQINKFCKNWQTSLLSKRLLCPEECYRAWVGKEDTPVFRTEMRCLHWQKSTLLLFP